MKEGRHKAVVSDHLRNDCEGDIRNSANRNAQQEVCYN